MGLSRHIAKMGCCCSHGHAATPGLCDCHQHLGHLKEDVTPRKSQSEPGCDNDVCASSSSLLGIKITMPATLFSLVLKWKAVFGVGQYAVI